jgi:hypothetical protein
MSRVFLSYAAEDRAFASRLKRALTAQGAETVDPAEDMKPGDDLSAAILKSLKRSDLLVFVVPRYEGQGKSALVELGAAKALGKRIVSVVPEKARVAYSDVASALGETYFFDGDRNPADWADQVLSELKAA